MEKQQDLDKLERVSRIQAQLKALPNKAGGVCEEDLEEIYKQ